MHTYHTQIYVTAVAGLSVPSRLECTADTTHTTYAHATTDTAQHSMHVMCGGGMVRGGSELHFNFKLPHSRSCVRELCVSAEVSPHALAIMIEKLYTKTSSPMLWQTSASSGWVSHISAHTACAAQVMAFGKAKKGNCVGMKTHVFGCASPFPGVALLRHSSGAHNTSHPISSVLSNPIPSGQVTIPSHPIPSHPISSIGSRHRDAVRVRDSD